MTRADYIGAFKACQNLFFLEIVIIQTTICNSNFLLIINARQNPENCYLQK